MPLSSYLPDPDKWIRTTPASTAKAKAKQRPLIAHKHGLPTPPTSAGSGRPDGHTSSAGASSNATAGPSRHKAVPTPTPVNVASRLKFWLDGGEEAGGAEGKGKDKERKGMPTPPTTSSAPRSRVQKLHAGASREKDTAGRRYNGSPAPIRRDAPAAKRSGKQYRSDVFTSPRKSTSTRATASRHDLDRSKRGERRVSALGREMSSSDIILEQFKRSSDGLDEADDYPSGRGAGHGGRFGGNEQAGPSRLSMTTSRTSRTPHPLLLRSHRVDDTTDRHHAGDDQDDDNGEITETDEPRASTSRLPVISSPPHRTSSRVSAASPARHAQPTRTSASPHKARPSFAYHKSPPRRASRGYAFSRTNERTKRPAPSPSKTSPSPTTRHPARSLSPAKNPRTSPDARPANAQASTTPKAPPTPANEPGYTPPDHSPLVLTQPPANVLKRYWSMNGTDVDAVPRGEEPWGKSKGWRENAKRVREGAGAVKGGQRTGDGEVMEERQVRALRQRDTGGYDLYLGDPGSEEKAGEGEGEGEVISLQARKSVRTPKDRGSRDAAPLPLPLGPTSSGSGSIRPGRTASHLSVDRVPDSFIEANAAIQVDPIKVERGSGTPKKKIHTAIQGADALDARSVLSPLRPNAATSRKRSERDVSLHSMRSVHSDDLVPSMQERPVKKRRLSGLKPVSLPERIHVELGRRYTPTTVLSSILPDEAYIPLGKVEAEAQAHPIRGITPLPRHEQDDARAPVMPPPARPLSERTTTPTASPTRLNAALHGYQHQITPPKPRPLRGNGAANALACLSPPAAPMFTSSSPSSSTSVTRSDDDPARADSASGSGSGSGSGLGRTSRAGRFRAVDVDETLVTWSLGQDAASLGETVPQGVPTVDGRSAVSASVLDGAPERPGARPLQASHQAGKEEGASKAGSDDTQSLAATAHSDSFPSLLQSLPRQPPVPVQTQAGPNRRSGASVGVKGGWERFGDLTSSTRAMSATASTDKPQSNRSDPSRSGSATALHRSDMFDAFRPPPPPLAADPAATSTAGPVSGSSRLASSSSSKAEMDNAPVKSHKRKSSAKATPTPPRKASRGRLSSRDSIGKAPAPASASASMPVGGKQATLQAFGIVRERQARVSAGERFDLEFEDEVDVVLDLDEDDDVGEDADAKPGRVDQSPSRANKDEQRRAGLRMTDAPPLHPGLRPAGVRAMRAREANATAAARSSRTPQSGSARPTSSSRAVQKRPASQSPSPSPEPVLFSPAKPPSDLPRVEGGESVTSLGPTQHSDLNAETYPSLYPSTYGHRSSDGVYHSSSSFLTSDDDIDGEADGGVDTGSGGLELEDRARGQEDRGVPGDKHGRSARGRTGKEGGVAGMVSKTAREWFDRLGTDDER